MKRSQKKADAKHSDAEKIPKYSSPTDYGFVISSELQNFDQKITTEMLRKMYLRNGICNKIVNKKANDVFDNGFKIFGNDALAKEVEQLNNDLDLINIHKQAYKYSKLYGYGFVAIGFNDSAELDEEPQNVKGIDYLSAISPEKINNIYLNEDPMSGSYGEIESIELKPFDIKGKKRTIHSSRLIAYINDPFNDNPKGVSEVMVAYNYFETLENIIWSVGQAYYRTASPFAVLKIHGADLDYLEEKDKKLDDLNSLTRFLGNENHEIDFKEVKAQDPAPFFEIALTATCSAMSMPKELVTGVAAGSITGSETNLRDYYSDISSEQTLNVEPKLRNFYEICREYKVLKSKGEYEFEWESLFELNDVDKAKVELLKSQAYRNYIEAGIMPKNPREEMPELLTDSIKSERAKWDAETTERERLDKLEMLENRYIDIMLMIFDPDKAKDLVEVIDTRSLPRKVYDFFAVPDQEPINEEDLEILRDEVEENARENERRFIELLPALVDGQMRSAGFSRGEEGYSQLRDGIYQSNFNYIKGFNEDLRKELSGILTRGIQSGWSKEQIGDEFERVMSSMTASRLRTIVRTETSRALNTAEFRKAQQENKKFKRWVTMGDERVRPLHEAVEGETVPVDEPFSLGVLYPPADPNCRCWVVYE